MYATKSVSTFAVAAVAALLFGIAPPVSAGEESRAASEESKVPTVPA